MIKFCIAVCFFFFNALTADLIQMRNLYEKLNNSEKNALALQQITNNSTSISSSLKQAYLAVTHMALAQYRVNPVYKWKAFNEGKTILEDIIKRDTSALEIRYIRLTIQQHAPSLLGYNTKIKSDRIFLISKLSSLKNNDPDLFARVYTYLLIKGNLTEAEKILINNKD